MAYVMTRASSAAPSQHPMPKAARPVLRRLLGIDQLSGIYEAARAEGGLLSRRLLDRLDISIKVAPPDLELIPRGGATVVMANHPCGLLEGAVLTTLLLGIRGDVKVLANAMLAGIPELRGLVIPVDVDSTGTNARATREALRHLMRRGLLLVFPAGEVAHFDPRLAKVTESGWRPEVVRLIEAAARRGRRPTLIPVHVPGRNSLLFQAAGLLHPGLRTKLLVRELVNKRGREVEVRIGAPIEWGRVAALESAASKSEYLRWRTGLLANRQTAKAMTRWPLRRRPVKPAAAVAAETPRALLKAEVAALARHCLLDASGELQVFMAASREIPSVLREIGRQRELAFRAAGEGSGNALDLDQFDEHYRHLFVWNSVKEEIVGAYRLALTEEVLPEHGLAGLYTAKLFRYGPELMERLGPAIELGRSFVRRKYQREFSPLLLLWKGIGKVVAANPRCRRLFGPVSISNNYQAASRGLIMRFLENCSGAREWKGLVQGRERPRNGGMQSMCTSLDELAEVVSEIEPGRRGLPVLLRHYLRLGGQLLSFSVDREFSEVLDGFMLVDLTRTEPRLLERYLGKESARQFLRYYGDVHEKVESISDRQLAFAAPGSRNSAADVVF